MTHPLGSRVEHRPSVYAVTTPGGWAYQVACACGARTYPSVTWSWRQAMAQALHHVAAARSASRMRERMVEAQVRAFRQRLG